MHVGYFIYACRILYICMYDTLYMHVGYLWWFLLFYVLVYKIFCAVGALCMFSYF